MDDKELLDFVLSVLSVVSKYGSHELLYWRTDEEYAPVSFWINCNDIFWWATSDSEPVTKESVPLLEQSFKDVIATGAFDFYGTILYCARQRRMRPQGAYYSHLPEKLWTLFDNCGPEREVDFNNPKVKPERGIKE